MTEVTEAPGRSVSRFYVSVWLPAAVLGVLLIVTLALQLALSWRIHVRLAPVSRHTAEMAKLQRANLALQHKLMDSLQAASPFGAEERRDMRNQLKAILDMQSNLEEKTPQALLDAQQVLADAALHPQEALLLALSRTREVLNLEGRRHEQLIQDISRTTALELEIGTITLLAFPAGAILLIYLMRRRILAPLERLSFLMTLLMRRDYAPAPVSAIDPMLRPLTENYNAMVARLAELEKAHAMREQDLESQVETATRTLLEQQRSLANTEQLAAVGEMMARIAHELRNPLAGVKLACTNLRQELRESQTAPEYLERVDVVAAEIDRIVAVLNSLLSQSRHTPEPLRETSVAGLVADLTALLRYQMPRHVRLEQRVAEAIVCRLPDALFRQALLNLVLNAQQAIGEQAGEIVITAAIEDGWLRLSVTDNGPGFPQDLLVAGIRAFVTHRTDGTGLGLSMVQRFARAHGGKVKLSNVLPHGACVTLELPCRGNDV